MNNVSKNMEKTLNRTIKRFFQWGKNIEKKHTISTDKYDSRINDRKMLFKQSSWDDVIMLPRYDPLSLMKSNVVVYRCISLIARSVASIKWNLKTLQTNHNQKENILNSETTELEYLIDSPNPTQCRVAFIENLVTNMLLFGKGYIYRTGTQFQSWQVLKSEHVHMECCKNGVPKAYIYHNGQEKITVPINTSTGYSDILHIQLTTADVMYDGTSPCTVISKVVEGYNLVTQHNISILKKGGRPSGMLVVNKDDLSLEKFQELEENIRNWNVGSSNAGEVLVTTSDCQWKEMGLKPIEANFSQWQHGAAREIAQVFGVPPMLIGIPGDATFANYKEARAHFWADTIIPLMEKICSALNVWFFNQKNVQICTDTSTVEALEAKKIDVWAQVDKINFLTLEEKRAYCGFE